MSPLSRLVNWKCLLRWCSCLAVDQECLRRRTGFDPVSNTSFKDIPVSDYSTTIYGNEQDPSAPIPPALKALVPIQLDGSESVQAAVGAAGPPVAPREVAADAPPPNQMREIV